MGKGSALVLDVKPKEGEPLFLAIAAAIVHAIGSGRLRPGDPLPGTRALARSLGTSRNTVDAGYHELTMQGWLAAEPSRGTFVARDLPDIARPEGRRRPGVAPTPEPVVPRPELSLSDGAPDPRLMPVAELGRALRRACTAPAVLAAGYGDPQGSAVLRDAVAAHLSAERGLAASGGDVLIARGSQMALYLAATAVAAPGEAIAVENPGYPMAWASFRAAGAVVRGVPVDDGGLDPDALERLARAEPRLRAVYVTPHHQYPTTATLGAARRLRLLDVARRYRLTIIEDDYDHEFRFDGRPVLPLAARAEADAPVIHVGSLSKLLAPGIRIGYAVAAPAALRRMVERREALDRQGDPILEHALATLIADGTLRRHAHRARRVYQERRNRMAALLAERFAGVADFTLPAGGLAVWLRLRGRESSEAWAANAAARGLSVLPGRHFALDGTGFREALRLGFAGLADHELVAALDRLAPAR